jgi:hypothetical protein
MEMSKRQLAEYLKGLCKLASDVDDVIYYELSVASRKAERMTVRELNEIIHKGEKALEKAYGGIMPCVL